MPHRCVVKSCGSPFGRRLITFPKDEVQQRLWIEVLGVPELLELNPEHLRRNRRVCDRHFHASDLIPAFYPGAGNHALLPGSVPIYGDVPAEEVRVKEEVMPVWGEIPLPEVVYVSEVSVPEVRRDLEGGGDAEVIRERPTSSKFGAKDHFMTENIIREWISEDGLTKVPYQISRFKKEAVPKISPDCSNHLTKKIDKRKLPTQRNILDTSEKSKTTITSVEAKTDFVPNHLSNENNIFENLWISPEQVILPESWGFHKIITETNSRVISYSSIQLSLSSTSAIAPMFERIVLISKDLQMMFFIRNIQYKSTTWKWNNQKLLSVCNLKDIIEEFSNLKICRGGPKVNLYSADKMGAVSANYHIDNLTNCWRHYHCLLIALQNNSCELCCKISINFDKQLKKSTIPPKVKNASTHKMHHRKQRRAKSEINKLIDAYW